MSVPTDHATSTTSAPPPGRERRRIGEVLLSAGAVTSAQLEQALAKRTLPDGSRERLGQTIVRHGFATDTDIASALARQLGLEFLDAQTLTVDPAMAALIPASLAERHGIVALRREPNGTLVIACSDPTDVVAMDDVRLATGARSVRPVVVTASVLDAALQSAYNFGSRAGELIDQLGGRAEEEELEEDLSATVDDAPVIRLAESILADALDSGASDIHVEPGAHGTTVRYRVDGVLRTVTTVPRSGSGSLLSRFKLMAGMDIAERRRPQDGRARLRGVKGEVDLRVSTLPSMFGETMVMRLLRKGADRLGIRDVGLDDEQLATALQAIERPQGLVLITGPTGSGKTSTLYAFLSHLAQETHNIITLEDPVEYQLDGINQTQINDAIGLSFARALRTVLRQDPDIVMVGEIRDPETAELALQASLTGHLVFSTLHTNDAPGAVVRLRDLGIPSYLISSALTLVVGQRLVRTICPRCSTAAEPTEAHVAQLRLSARDLETADFRIGAGCNSCNNSGYKGRLGVLEVLTADGRTREVLAAGGGEVAIRQAARTAGMRSLREDAIAKAKRGITTLDEVLRVTPTDAVDHGVCPACVQPVEPDFDHCPWCAADLSGLSCTHCHRELHLGWKVCPSCGTPAGARGDDPVRPL